MKRVRCKLCGEIIEVDENVFPKIFDAGVVLQHLFLDHDYVAMELLKSEFEILDNKKGDVAE